MTKTTKGFLLLSAVASLAAFAGDKVDTKAAPKAGKEAATIRCQGINECKAKGECGSATYDCAGNNECKGKGWITVTAKECKDKKGTVLGSGTK